MKSTYRLSLLLFLVLTLTQAASAQTHSRKKVGVVLSGGGAKGTAHVRALKVIEEAGIPVDIVVGTSMGSLIGGMYATGFTPEQMDTLLHQQDWKVLLTDITPRTDLKLEQRLRMDNYMLKARFTKSPYEVIEGGLLKGNNVARLISQATAQYADSINYDKLRIPFACVATDIVTGEEIDMRSGYLAESMRASMAIPGVFSPVRKGKRVLVDGGLTNNYPADVARKMGADIIIGVDVMDEEEATAESINSAKSVLMQLVSQACEKKVQENLAITDIHIKVNVKGYSAASFTSKAIDTLMARGEMAAREKWDELIELRKSLGITGEVKRNQYAFMPELDPNITPRSSIFSSAERNSFIGLGARFDNEELASLLIGGIYEFNHRNRLSAGLEARLGRRVDGKLYGSIHLSKSWMTQLTYNIIHNDMRIYHNSKRVAQEVYTGHDVGLNFAHNWSNFRIDFGLNYAYYHFDDPLVQPDFVDWDIDNSAEGSLSYKVRLTYDSRDASINATHGMTWGIGYRYLTNNGATFEGHSSGLHILDLYWNMPLRLSRTTVLTPFISGRWISDYNTYFTQQNFIGGINANGHYIGQQISFAGINYVQMTVNNLAVGGISLRQYITTNNYAFLIANYGNARSRLFDTDAYMRHMVGAAIGWGYKTPVGPIELDINWSNVTRKVGFFLNLGYMF